jgi:hypothetical protein
MVLRFVDIGGIVDHHCFDVLSIIIYTCGVILNLV